MEINFNIMPPMSQKTQKVKDKLAKQTAQIDERYTEKALEKAKLSNTESYHRPGKLIGRVGVEKKQGRVFDENETSAPPSNKIRQFAQMLMDKGSS